MRYLILASAVFMQVVVAQNPVRVNNAAWAQFEQSMDPDSLRATVERMEGVIDGAPENFYFLDTYANLLYKLAKVHGIGSTCEAIAWQEQAISLIDESTSARGAQVGRESLEKMRNGEPTWPQQHEPSQRSETGEPSEACG